MLPEKLVETETNEVSKALYSHIECETEKNQNLNFSDIIIKPMGNQEADKTKADQLECRNIVNLKIEIK